MPPKHEDRLATEPPAPADPGQVAALQLEAAHVLVAWHSVRAEHAVAALAAGSAGGSPLGLRRTASAAEVFAVQLAGRLEDSAGWCGHPETGLMSWRAGQATLLCQVCLRDTLDATTSHLGGGRCEACGNREVRGLAWVALGPVVVAGLYCEPCASPRGERPSKVLRRTQAAVTRIRRVIAAELATKQPAELLQMQSVLLRQVETLAGQAARDEKATQR